MFDKNERATALLALRSSASSTSSPMYSPECSVSTCAQHKAAITMRLTYRNHMHTLINMTATGTPMEGFHESVSAESFAENPLSCSRCMAAPGERSVAELGRLTSMRESMMSFWRL